MKRNPLIPHHYQSALLLIVGTIIAAYGITLAIHAGFGGATLAILWQGVAKTLHITLGTASFIIALVMLIIVFFLDKKQIFWGTLIYQIIYSLMVDVFKNFVFYTNQGAINFCIMLLGVAIFSAGNGIYSAANLGKGPYEALTFSLHNKTGLQIRTIRILFDLFFVIIGFLLGGTPGLCTVVTLFLSGPMMQFVYKKASSLHNNRPF